MPIVLSSKGKNAQYVNSDDDLALILGHSNFDGEDWSIGDAIVFEDSTTATIICDVSKSFYVWTDQESVTVDEVIQKIERLTGAKAVDGNLPKDVSSIIETYRRPNSAGCFSVFLSVALIVWMGLFA